tara:strand:- start:316 stop:471 length:156 start_codon:yes stop_codon:yes gene_type:complete
VEKQSIHSQAPETSIILLVHLYLVNMWLLLVVAVVLKVVAVPEDIELILQA